MPATASHDSPSPGNHPPTRGEVAFGEALTPRAHLARAAFTSGPAFAWLALFLALPLLAIATISFLSRGDYGELQLPFTLDGYRRLAGFGELGYDPVIPMIVLRSLMLGLTTTVLCLLAAFPLAWWIAALPARWKTAALALVVIPFWTNLLIRTYAWQILLAPESPLCNLAAALGFLPPGGSLYPGTFAVALCMACDYLPFMVLPVYASMEKVDWSVAEAAMDLGAGRWGVIRHAVLPQVQPGLLAGVMLTFLPATGQFVIPDLLGGAKTVMLGNIIQQQFGSARDWPFGCAIVVPSLLMLGLSLWVFQRLASRSAASQEGEFRPPDLL